jgi:DNA-binding CsgD family transcriptional regulator
MAMAEPNDNLDDTIGRLTQRERECLRLVAQLMTSKQIALQLGISKHTVDERIESARRRIGARGRYEAARLLAAREGNGLFPPTESGPHSIGLADSNGHATLGAAPGEQGNVGTVSLESKARAEHQPERAAGPVVAEQAVAPSWLLDRSRLGVAARLGVVLLMVVLSALAFGGILSGLDALKRLH